MAILPEDLLSSLKTDLLSQDLPSQGGEPWPGISISEAAALSITNSLLKKLSRGHTDATDVAALEKFLQCNTDCGNWELPVDYDSKTETLLGELRHTIDQFWHKASPTFPGGVPLWDHPYDLLERASIGPGANIGAKGGDFYTKFYSSKLSCSDRSLYFWYSRYIRSFPEMSNAENIRKLEFGEASVTPSSRLSYVPKNDKISRCICTEPTLNTYFQLGIGACLEERLKVRFGIDLADQQFKNRDLARLGSITDGLSTIDLSSASDSISMKMLKWLLPAGFIAQLEKYRTHSVDVKGRGTIPLNMVSTMGNGFTFPLQTMLFACVVVACLKFRGIPWRSRTSSDSLWGVFGDDIICPRSITGDVLHLLALLGFRVNHDKTFVEGPFRESCGADFFMGSDIRGVYVKDVDTPASRYSVINLLVRFQTKTGIYLPRTIGVLLDSVEFLPVPRWEDMSAGIHLPSSHESVRKLPRQKDIAGQPYYGSSSKTYRCLVPVQPKIVISDRHVVVPSGYKRRMFNPSGLHVSYLQGSVRSYTIGVRAQGPIRYKIRRRSTSCWDARPTSVRDRPDFDTDWWRWEISTLGGLA